MRRRPLSACLILLLLTMQYAALAHSVGHLLAGEQHSDCPTCTLSQHFKHNPPAGAVPPPELNSLDSVAPASPPAVFYTAARAFQSRAPPLSPR